MRVPSFGAELIGNQSSLRIALSRFVGALLLAAIVRRKHQQCQQSEVAIARSIPTFGIEELLREAPVAHVAERYDVSDNGEGHGKDSAELQGVSPFCAAIRLA